MKLTFELVTAYDVATFNELVNLRLVNGYRFMTDNQVIICEHEGMQGSGYQYSVAMLKEEA